MRRRVKGRFRFGLIGAWFFLDRKNTLWQNPCQSVFVGLFALGFVLCRPSPPLPTKETTTTTSPSRGNFIAFVTDKQRAEMRGKRPISDWGFVVIASTCAEAN